MQPAESGPVVLLATGSEVLDAALVARKEWRLGGQVLYREAVGEKTARARATVVVLACSLSGGVDLPEVIYGLRRRDIRVILLAGDRENADRRLLNQAVGLGVYDLLFDPVRPDEVVRAILQPAGFAAVAAWLETNGETAAEVSDAAPDPGATPVRRIWYRPARPPAPPTGDAPGPAPGSAASLAEAGVAYQAAPGEAACTGSTPGHRWVTRDDPPRSWPVRKHGPGRVIAFASPRGGVGRSFLAVAFGIWLAGQREEAVLVELDGGGGRTGVGWRYGDRGTGGPSLLVHPSGLRMVRGDQRVSRAPNGEAAWAGLLDGLVASFGTVLVTLPAAAGEGTPDILGRAAPVFLVATPERAVLYDVQREFYHYRRLGLDPAQVRLVLNRRGRRSSLRVGEVGGLVPLALCTIVPESGATPEEALRERRFRRCLAELGRAAGYPLPTGGAGAAGRVRAAGQGPPLPGDA